jgi:hypothetical protein
MALWFLCVSGYSAADQRALEDLNWGIAQADGCRESLFSDLQSLRRAGGEGLAVGIRLLDTQGIERELVLTKRGEGLTAAVGVVIAEVPLSKQLAAIHAKDPNLGPREACTRVKTSSVKTDSDTRLEDAIAELKSLSFNPVLQAPFVLHGKYYKIWVFSGSTASHYDFGGVASDSTERSPLQTWSDRLLKVMWPDLE